MIKIIKKTTYIIFILFISLMVVGCNSKEKKNSNSKLAEAKRLMNNNLENFSYDVNITMKTDFGDTTTKMNCKEDQKNEIAYCSLSTFGVQTKEYFDYKNKVMYTYVYSPYSASASNGIWTKKTINESSTSNWLNLSDYIYDLKEESRDGGMYYTGTIDSKKLASAMATTNSNVNMNNLVSEDIKIAVLVNKSGYIEQMSFDIKIMGVQESVDIRYHDYNTSGSLDIPKEVISNK